MSRFLWAAVLATTIVIGGCRENAVVPEEYGPSGVEQWNPSILSAKPDKDAQGFYKWEEVSRRIAIARATAAKSGNGAGLAQECEDFLDDDGENLVSVTPSGETCTGTPQGTPCDWQCRDKWVGDIKYTRCDGLGECDGLVVTGAQFQIGEATCQYWNAYSNYGSTYLGSMGRCW